MTCPHGMLFAEKARAVGEPDAEWREKLSHRAALDDQSLVFEIASEIIVTLLVLGVVTAVIEYVWSLERPS